MRPSEDFRLDGVPVFTAAPDEVMPGHTAATIIFRVGAHDEIFGTAGITELTRHLIHACLPVELRDYVTTDSDGLFTEFTVMAPDDQFGTCMTALADAITNPDWSKLGREQDLLMAADRLELAWPEEQFLACRYGTVGAGTTVVRKFSFGHIQPAVVENWIAERFNRNNAVVIACGMLGPGTTFVLNNGDSFDVPANHSLENHTPAYIEAPADQEGVIAFQFAVPAGARARLGLVLIAQLIERRLITFETFTRDVAFSSRMVDNDTRVLTGFLSTPPHQVGAALKAVQETVVDLAEGRSGRDMFEEQRDDVARGLLNQMASVDATLHTARTYLMPSLESLEGQIDKIATMTLDDLANVGKLAAASALYQAPKSANGVLDNVPTWKPPQVESVSGTSLRLRGVLRLLRRKARLTYSNDGVTHFDGKGSVTIRFETCSAVIDNGLSITLVDASGEIFVFYKDAWERGHVAEALVRDKVSIGKFVQVDPTEEERREHATIKASVERFAPRRAIGLLTRPKHA